MAFERVTCAYCSRPPLPGRTGCSECLESQREKAREWRANNRERHRKQARLWREQNPEEASRLDREKNWRKKYGLSPQQYEDMFESQGGRCKLCGSTGPGNGHEYFCVDHHHGSGRVRGLLCHNCNTAIGLLKDDPVLCEAAAVYLRE